MVDEQQKQVIRMDDAEKVYLETRIRNLERKYARLTQHADLTDMASEIKTEINNLKSKLQ